MKTEIRKDSYRRSRVLFLLGLASLVGLFGLGSYLYHHPEVVIPHLVGRLASVAFFGVLIKRGCVHSCTMTVIAARGFSLR